MDDSVRSTIEKIKLQEQDNEIRLREKREFNAAISTLTRSIRDISSNTDKLVKEQQSLIVSTDKLEYQVLLEKIRQSALADQVNICRKELDDLQKTSVNGVSSVWEKRSQLFETIHCVSNKCDIWALLIKPTTELKTSTLPVLSNEPIPDGSKLKAVIERKDRAIAMRNLLMNEPDVGEEFIRTRNALQYSMEILASEQED